MLVPTQCEQKVFLNGYTEAKLDSTAENERGFSCLDRVVSKTRTCLSEVRVESLVKISFESSRRPENKSSLLKYQKRVEFFLPRIKKN